MLQTHKFSLEKSICNDNTRLERLTKRTSDKLPNHPLSILYIQSSCNFIRLLLPLDCPVLPSHFPLLDHHLFRFAVDAAWLPAIGAIFCLYADSRAPASALSLTISLLAPWMMSIRGLTQDQIKTVVFLAFEGGYPRNISSATQAGPK